MQQVDASKLLALLQQCIHAAKEEKGSIPFKEYAASVTSTQTTAAFVAGLIARETGASLGTLFDNLEIPYDASRLKFVTDTIKEIFPQSTH